MRHRRSCRAAGHVTLAGLSALQAHTHSPSIPRAGKGESERENDLPSVHGEISVEHLFAHLFPLDSAGKFQVCELVSQQVRLHEPLQMDGTMSEVGL